MAIDFSLTREIMPREGTDNWRVLMMLLDAPFVRTNVEFCDAHLANFRSRLSELRNTFHWNIPTGERVREGVYKYRLERTGE
jgi:hypothetical protein